MNLAGFLAIFSTKDPKFRVYRKLECVYKHGEPRTQIPERFKGSHDGKSMTAQQPHQTMDYVLLEMLDRSPQLSRLIIPRVVLLAGVHWPGEKNQQLVFVTHISISTVLQERNQTTLLNLGLCMFQQIRYANCVIMRAHDCQCLI